VLRRRNRSSRCASDTRVFFCASALELRCRPVTCRQSCDFFCLISSKFSTHENRCVVTAARLQQCRSDCVLECSDSADTDKARSVQCRCVIASVPRLDESHEFSTKILARVLETARCDHKRAVDVLRRTGGTTRRSRRSRAGGVVGDTDARTPQIKPVVGQMAASGKEARRRTFCFVCQKQEPLVLED
jgi:hypothetical protein